ncbi:MAG TPA: hypothetical protein PKD38_11420, partial [Nitrospira sp.]|nr:hypothetical protein [Nitrospira sp.]
MRTIFFGLASITVQAGLAQKSVRNPRQQCAFVEHRFSLAGNPAAGVQTANPANLGLHSDAIEAPRSRPPYRILAR